MKTTGKKFRLIVCLIFIIGVALPACDLLIVRSDTCLVLVKKQLTTSFRLIRTVAV